MLWGKTLGIHPPGAAHRQSSNIQVVTSNTLTLYFVLVQVLYMFMQQYVDRLVARQLDCSQGPEQWFKETLDAANVSSFSSTRDFVPGHDSGKSGASVGSDGQVRMSPMAAVLWRLTDLVNPGQLVSGSGLSVEFLQNVPDSHTADASQGALSGQLAGGSQASPSTQTSKQSTDSDAAQSQPPYPALPFSLMEVPLLTPAQMSNIAEFVFHDTSLQWPQPTFNTSLKVHMALATHRRIFSDEAEGRMPEALQRPPLTGANAPKVTGSLVLVACFCDTIHTSIDAKWTMLT